MKYHEILSENKRLKNGLAGDEFPVVVLSNIIVHQLKEILEFELAREGLKSRVEFGNYDTILQDAAGITSDTRAVIVFMELSNITDGLEYKADLLSGSESEELLTRIQSELHLLFQQLKAVPLVIFNRFSSLAFNAGLVEENAFDRLAKGLNAFLDSGLPSNVRLVDINKPLIITGVDAAVDLRNYYSSKALYSVDFFRNYAGLVKHILLPLSGKINKALIFDCDNTLWLGVLGEDGFDGIKMNAATAKGKPFAAVQHMALKLAREGVLIGLCSKNNAEDVDEVIDRHADIVLKSDHLTIKMVNWSDKAGNLKEMAEILNIGLDSFVFVEDSDFELGLVNEQVPEVKTLKVNEKNHLYPKEFATVLNRFYRLSRSEEDLNKVKMYKQQARREASRSAFNDIQSYLDSLEIKIEVFRNEASMIPRMSQLTQKTNQFNLTTRRYSESEMENMVQSPDVDVYALSVEDRYGDSGITGLAIVKAAEGISEIDTLLMSCRVIGRKIEDAFIAYFMNEIQSQKITASYIATRKNAQVREFYDHIGFRLISESNGVRTYELKRNEYTKPKITHISVKNGTKA